MIKIEIVPTLEGTTAWIRFYGPNSREKVLTSELYSTYSNARRSAKVWQNRFGHGACKIIDHTKSR